MTQRVDQQLGNYHVSHLLGRGVFADVFLGEHKYLNTRAAIKVLHAPLELHAQESFLTEARHLSLLIHPHIIRVLDFGMQDQIPYLVMDYAPGGNLRQLHPAGTVVPLSTVVTYVMAIASALQHAHDQHVLHRDLKPENLLLGSKHEVLLGDFGLALLTSGTDALQVQERFGPLAYMAPEQMSGQPCPASDQYALAVLVYEWLSGSRPFGGTVAELSVQHRFAEPASLREQQPEIPAAVEQVILKALSKDPVQRYVDVLGFATAFEEASHATFPASSVSASSAGTAIEAGTANTTLGNLKTYVQNLPVSLTPLIGREQELKAARARLSRPQVRLMTLTGTPGVGKTRLAMALEAELLEEFDQGACFISLIPISDPDLVIPTIIHTLGLPESRDRSPLEHLAAYLREKQFLLLLDNFEHLLPAASLLPELLATCPRLKLLVTSRTTLHVKGEYEFAVPPLAVPDLQSLPTYETLSQIAAVELFVQNVEAVKPGFALTEDNAAVIAEICVRLEGLPLAIELAAARSKLLSLQALLSRLEHRLEVLTGGKQDAPLHQQTLRNTIAWSYNLLSAEKQTIFRSLCVFVGDFTLDAAEAVVSALGGLTTSVLDGIASLVDSGMVELREEQGHEPLLYIFEAIREYGVELLEAHGEMERSRVAHAAYYLTLSEQAEISLLSATQRAWLERLEQEFKNIRAALQWLLARREAIPALSITSALRQFWFLQGRLSEGRRFLKQALEVSSEGNEGIADLLRAKALAVAGFLALRQHDPRPAIASLEESLALFRRLEDKPGMAASLWWLGTVEHVLGEVEAGVAKVEESLSLYREVGDTENCADVLLSLGTGALSRGAYGRARELLEESLALFQAADVTHVKAMDLHYLGFTYFAQGQYTHAHQFSEESLELFRMLGVPFFASEVMTILAYELAALGERARARSLLEEALIIARERENTEDLVRVLCGIGHLALLQDNLTEARSCFEEGIAKMQGRWLNPRIKWVVASCLEGLGAIALAQEGHAKWTVRLFAAAETVRAANGYYSPFGIEQPFYEQTLAQARSQLSEKAFALAWAAGQAMTPQQAVAIKEQTLPLEGVSLLPPAIAQPTPAPAIPGGLTEREVEVLRLAAMGMSNKQIADQLVLSPNTVNAHIQSIYRKIDVNSRSSATRFAIEHQLI